MCNVTAFYAHFLCVCMRLDKIDEISSSHKISMYKICALEILYYYYYYYDDDDDDDDDDDCYYFMRFCALEKRYYYYYYYA